MFVVGRGIDGKTLYVADIRAKKTYRYRIQEDGSMTKADIVEDIAQRTGLTKKEVGETVDLEIMRGSQRLSFRVPV